MNRQDFDTENNERIVVRYTTSHNNGVMATRYTRNVIGYVFSGEKYIHNDDRLYRVGAGELFFLNQGAHQIENIPTEREAFEQIVFYYTPLMLQQIIASLDTSRLNLDTNPNPQERDTVSVVPTRITRNFFVSANRHYEYGGFLHNPESERLHLLELTLNILNHENNIIKECVLQSLDQQKAEFERIIHNNLLTDKSVEELASECSRSLTSFKKEFKRIFGMPPHQWYLKQRLNYARLLLSTTRESIAQIGIASAFPNTSHFIKLFKRHFGSTPAVYRSTHKHESEMEELRRAEAMRCHQECDSSPKMEVDLEIA